MRKSGFEDRITEPPQGNDKGKDKHEVSDKAAEGFFVVLHFLFFRCSVISCN